MMDAIKPLRLIFMGSADFAVPILKTLVDAGHKISCVYTQPPRPAGRGQREHRCPVHAYAAASNIEVRTPLDFCNQKDLEGFKVLGVDAAIVAAYGILLPSDILAAPKFGCLNVHASLLPRWRGAAPIQRAILAGDVSTGVTIMAMEKELDTGPIYAIEEMPIMSGMTAQDVHDRLAALGGAMMVEVLEGVANGTLTSTPQPRNGITYAKKLKKDEGRIDWTRRSVDIERQVRALTPWPGAWFFYNGQRIKVLAAHVDDGEGHAGTVIRAPLYVACCEGSLCIDRLQRAGKDVMDVKEYLRGSPIPVGCLLG